MKNKRRLKNSASRSRKCLPVSLRKKTSTRKSVPSSRRIFRNLPPASGLLMWILGKWAGSLQAWTPMCRWNTKWTAWQAMRGRKAMRIMCFSARMVCLWRWWKPNVPAKTLIMDGNRRFCMRTVWNESLADVP